MSNKRVDKKGKAQAASGKKRRRRKGNNTLWYLLVCVFMVTTVIVLTTTVFFNIKTITVKGNTKYGDRDLIISSGISLEENMFRLNDRKIQKTLVEEYSYISKVKIRRKLPDSIVLEITEATPVGAIDAGVGYTLISAEGRVLEVNTPIIPDHLPVIFGFSEETPPQGSYLDEAQSENVSRMRIVMDAVEETGFPFFDVVDLSDPYDIRLYYQDLFEIVLGTASNIPYKLELITAVVENENLLTTFKGTIDASSDGEVWTRPSSGITVPAYSDPETAPEGDVSSQDPSDSGGDSSAAEDIE